MFEGRILELLDEVVVEQLFGCVPGVHQHGVKRQLLLADAYFRQARALEEAGEYEQALDLYQKALAIDRDQRSKDAAIYLNDIGDIHIAQQRFNEAYQASLKLKEKHWGAGHSEVSITLNRLGVAYQDLGNYAAAKVNIERALAIDEKVYGPEHPEVATLLNNLAGVYGDLGDFRKRSYQS